MAYLSSWRKQPSSSISQLTVSQDLATAYLADPINFESGSKILREALVITYSTMFATLLSSVIVYLAFAVFVSQSV